MAPPLLMRYGFAISVCGHAVLILGLMFAGANPFDSVSAEAITVDIVSSDEIGQAPNESAPPPDPTFGFGTAPAAQDPAAAPAPAPQQQSQPKPPAPPRTTPQRNARQAAVQSQPAEQPSPQTAPQVQPQLPLSPQLPYVRP